MAFDETLAARIRKNLARMKNIEEKKMFGRYIGQHRRDHRETFIPLAQDFLRHELR